MGKIIAIVGMCGSGKSVASEYLIGLGYKRVYYGGVTMDKLKESGLDVNPDNEKMMREKLRSELGMGAYAKVLLPTIKELSLNNDVVLDGLYSWDELVILNNEFKITTIAVVADKKIRYDRLSRRTVRPFGKSDAIKRDISEIENIAKAGPIAYADYYIFNNGTINDFHNRLNEILNNIKE